MGRKVQAIAMLWVLLAAGAYAMQKTWVYIAFPMIGTAVTCHLLLIKTVKRPREDRSVSSLPQRKRSGKEG